jgi:hypothetical protein
MLRIAPVCVAGRERVVPCRWRPRKWTCRVPILDQSLFSQSACGRVYAVTATLNSAAGGTGVLGVLGTFLVCGWRPVALCVVDGAIVVYACGEQVWRAFL